MSHIQDVQRAIVMPPLAPDAPAALQEFVRVYIAQLAQQVQSTHNSFESQEVAVANLAANATVTWTTPAPESSYIVSALPSWATIVSFSAKAIASVQLNFSVAAPGAQTVLVLRVR